ncbi:peptidase associated/transthyretin-like domain-containing protein [Tenacibaculum jejuense]|uniref:Uncharacterized protein n=1 Tax=Tenacibaculum jejuense TaxID=584609 RepID=A0A238UAQ1_9FLAO|nr:hypothetical protein [Tenacibaculum jejuense]SNR16155.1 Protein of unknown function precursor [Tenacibaculum jejuense]
MRNLITILFFSLSSFTILSQETTILEGKIIDTTGSIADAHVVNRTTKKGAISDENGKFEISVSINDIIEISSIQHYKRIITVTKEIFDLKKLECEVFLKSNLLNEVEVTNGDLFSRFQSTVDPKMQEIALVSAKNTLDFSNVKPVANSDYNQNDEVNKRLNNIVDPTKRFEGASFGFALPFSRIKKDNKQKRELRYKEKFPKLLKAKLGADFFHKKLGIPKDKYHNFLLYCEPLGIENLFKNGDIIGVMDIFFKESKTYLKLIHR